MPLKLFTYLALMFAFIIIPTSTQATENPFIGTWQLVSGEYVNDKKEVVSYHSLEIRSQKVISSQHFSFVSMSKNKFWSAGTGTYTFTKNEYYESPTMASYPLEDGGTYTFTYQIKEGLWHNARWHGDTRVEYEIWKKVQ
ncbi:MAG: hypothetical protein ACPG46_11505 [Thalassotalea sp.]